MLTSNITDGRSERKHRSRNPRRARRVHEDGLAYQTLHHRDGAVDLLTPPLLPPQQIISQFASGGSIFHRFVGPNRGDDAIGNER